MCVFVCACTTYARARHILLLLAFRIFFSFSFFFHSSCSHSNLGKCMQFVGCIHDGIADWYDKCETKSKYVLTIPEFYDVVRKLRSSVVYGVHCHAIHSELWHSRKTERQQHMLQHWTMCIASPLRWHSKSLIQYAGNPKIGKTNRWKLENNRAKWNCIFDLA